MLVITVSYKVPCTFDPHHFFPEFWEDRYSFWDHSTDQHLVRYINNPSDTLFQDHLFQPFLELSRAVVSIYHWDKNDENLASMVMVHCVDQIKRFKQGSGYSYFFTIAKNYVRYYKQNELKHWTTLRINSTGCRDDTGSEIPERSAQELSGEYKEFIKKYWSQHLASHFNSEQQRRLGAILIAIIDSESPTGIVELNSMLRNRYHEAYHSIPNYNYLPKVIRTVTAVNRKLFSAFRKGSPMVFIQVSKIEEKAALQEYSNWRKKNKHKFRDKEHNRQYSKQYHIKNRDKILKRKKCR